MDELSRRALERLPGSFDEVAQEETPGLPLLVPNPPVGMSKEEHALWMARWYHRLFRFWAEVLARRWKLSPDARLALSRAASSWAGGPIEAQEAKVRIALSGLLEALGDAREPQRVRVGKDWVKDENDEVVDIIPANQGIIGGQLWLAQGALARARQALQDLEPWDRAYPPSERAENALTDEAEHPLDSLIAAEAPLEFSRLLEQATPGQARVLDALRAALSEVDDLAAAKPIAAGRLGISVSTIDGQIRLLRQRMGLI